MRSRRVLVVLGAVVAALAITSPAYADDLEDYLEMAADAEYAGSRVVLTVWDGRSVAEMTRVEHSGHVTMLGPSGFEAVIADGKVAHSEGAGIALATWSAPALADRYSVGAVQDTDRLGRAARAVEILEHGELRAWIVFDAATWAPLVTEIYDGTGELFRIASFTEFDPHPRRVFDATPHAGHDYDVVAQADGSSLPADAGGYARVDIYTDAAGMHQTFFSDGLFSFSVFEVTPRQVRHRFGEEGAFVVRGVEYRAIVRPSELWVAWVHGSNGYVLVGDLPPDHLRDVLSDLPEPRSRGLLERIFSFFG